MSSRKTRPFNNPSPKYIEEFKSWIFELQDQIVAGLQECEEEKFNKFPWNRDDENGKGDGCACVIEGGKTFEKAGINVTQLTFPLNFGVFKTMKDQNHMKNIQQEDIEKYNMFACGLSLVIHPLNPFVPTVHANYRTVMVINKETNEIEDWWFGGGSDLTPIYLNIYDAIYFHSVLKKTCDKFDKDLYPQYKTQCDKYFYIPYRKEARGIGGIFFENLNDQPFEDLFDFVKSCGNSFVDSYCPIVKRRMKTPYTEEHVEFRKWRRSRYAEFNLVFDRGTKFGLNAPNVKVENILMSLPLTCSWKFDYQVKNKKEEEIMNVLKNPRDWINHPVAVLGRKLSLMRTIPICYPMILESIEKIDDCLSKSQESS